MWIKNGKDVQNKRHKRFIFESSNPRIMSQLTTDELQTIKSIISREIKAWETLNQETEIDNNHGDDHLIVNAYFRKANIQYLNRIKFKLETEILKS